MVKLLETADYIPQTYSSPGGWKLEYVSINFARSWRAAGRTIPHNHIVTFFASEKASKEIMATGNLLIGTGVEV